MDRNILHQFQPRLLVCTYYLRKSAPPLLLDRRSIDLSGAQEKEGHFRYKNFLRASK